MIFLTLDQVLALQRILIDETGGSHGIRDKGAVESAVAQPQMSFGGADLYPTLIEKSAALCFSLIQNHPFIDGNKRIGLAAMAAFLRANGRNLTGTADEQEQVILAVADGQIEREEFTAWVQAHVVEYEAK